MSQDGKSHKERMAKCHAHIAEMEREIFGGPTSSERLAMQRVQQAQQAAEHHYGGSMTFDPGEWLRGN